ncbi:L,D-transpeptidase [Lactiplantibacillus herbarum]|uniref:L,D-transpeptidase n=1 Tax=Lactiplantibacillus herbarum TaxID=1670446 RepID=UPI00064F8589|nr:L,D-transpeptidase [Lactiplantibacillus herbarum]
MQFQARKVLWLTISASSLTIFAGFGHLAVSHHRLQASTAHPVKTTPTTHRSKPAKVVPIDWHAPSMKKSYPNLTQYPDLKIRVSIADQRVYLESHYQKLYTMLASTGKTGDDTPKGSFEIQPERGLNFYNSQSGEGANYWVSFKDHGIYLFHSVPVDAQGHYVVREAEQLGKVANSHGCIRLTISDAKWLYENIPTHTPVEVS